MESYSVKAILTADISNFTAGMSMAAQSLKALSTGSSPIENIGRVAGVAGKALTIGLTLPLAGVGAASLKVGSNFEAGMSKVQAVSGATSSEMEMLSKLAFDLGTNSEHGAGKAAEALTYMGMAGWDAQQMAAGLPGVLNLATASGEDLGRVSDIVTDSLTAFGMKASDTNRFVDILATASSKSNTNVGLMGETFKYVAPLAGAMGYSAEDTALALGLMANAGIKGSMAGTALRTSLSRLEKQGTEVQRGMKMLGLEMKDLEGLTLDQKLQTLRKAFQGLDKSQKVQAASLLFGQNAMAGMLAIIDASDEEYNSLKQSIYDSAGAAEKMAMIMRDNLQGSMNQFKSALEGVGIAIAEHLGPKVRVAIDALTNLARSFLELSPSTQAAIVNFGLVAAAIGPVLLIISKLISTFTKVQGAVSVASGAFTSFKAIMAGTATPIGAAGQAMAGLSKILGALAGPIGIAIAAVVAFIAIMVKLYQTNEQVREIIDSAWNAIKSTVQAASEAVAGFVQDIWGRISEFMGTVSQNIGEVVSTAWQAIGNTVATVMQTIAPIVQLGWETVKLATQVAWEVITTVIQVALELILGVIEAGMLLLQGDWQGAWEVIKETVTVIWQSISESATVIFEALKEYFMTLWEGIKESIVTAWEGIKESLVSTWEGIIQSAKEKWEGLKEFFSTLWDGIKSGATSAWEGIKGAIMSVIGPLVKSVQDSFKTLKDALKTIWENIKTIGQTVWSAIKTIIFGLVAALLQAITGDWEGAKETLNQIWNKLKGDAKTIWEAIKQTIQTTVKAAVDIAKNLMDGLKNTIQSIWDNIKTNISNAVDNIKTKIQTGFENAKTAAIDKVNNMKTAVTEGFQNIVSTIQTKMSEVPQKVRQGFSQAISEAKSFASQGVSVGRAMIQGFINGITSLVGNLISAARDAVSRAISAAKAVAGIHSPSRVFKAMGVDLIAGGVIGIDKEAPQMAKASADAMKDTIKAFGNPQLEIGAIMDKLNGSIGAQVDYNVRDNMSMKQPAIINMRMGERLMRAFVEDITDIQGQEVRLQEVYGV